mmetsp:Transcript_17332/g.23952  ORF Transcript_17332/g.23952 Transcript_17332/m.23952 type:complete len:247 (-) Transcript_17332:133-873(-)|eukprot:CAMPEP_0196581646 /NCGR_PEP_ID=MMETSP1081-20130531/34805_1 /TAXON_ID=36882 /ORGANISM="Pyramimonas amylifera, Strain CCMP720" /LENGTH=246 /DNA_ID=CAMNT_0041901959 /DNA_START=100 /DNA_END=840 /DNA_ORIENTATION=-
MFNRLFGKQTGPSGGVIVAGGGVKTNPLETVAQLKETLLMLEKRESLLWKKAGEELERAKVYTKEKNKRAAMQCLKRKKMYETQADQVSNNQLRVHDQVMLLEGSQSTAQTVQAMRAGAAALKNMQKETNIENVENVMDEINEQTDNMRAVQEALGQPSGMYAEFDDDELDAELNELEALELDEQLLEPGVPNTGVHVPTPVPTLPAAPALPTALPATRTPAQKAPAQKTPEELEMEALEAEMALA